jgi:hypothetical protein
MLIIGVDYHPSFQTIAFLMEETGECGEQELNHSDGEAEKFYRDLNQRGVNVRVGLEATGYSRCSSGYWHSAGTRLAVKTKAKTARSG